MDAFQIEKEQLFSKILRLLVVIGLIGYIPSVIASVIQGFFALALTDTLVYLLIILGALYPSIKYGIKVWLLVSLSLVLGVVVLINTGAQGAGYIWIISGIILAAIFGSRRLSISSIVASSLLLFLYAIGLNKGLPGFGLKPLSIIIIASNILVLSIALSVVIRSILKSLSTSLQNQLRLATRLESELSDMRIIRDKLSSSLEEKDALLQEINHRVNNNMQMIQSLIALESASSGETCLLQHRIHALAVANELIHIDSQAIGADLVDILQAILAIEPDEPLYTIRERAMICHFDKNKLRWFMKPQTAIIAALCIEEALSILETIASPLRIFVQEQEGEPLISISLPTNTQIPDEAVFEATLKTGTIARAAEGLFAFKLLPANDSFGPGILLKGQGLRMGYIMQPLSGA